MIDISLNGTISIPNEFVDKFIKDLDEFLINHNSQFHGSIRYHEFDDCEIIEENEEMSS